MKATDDGIGADPRRAVFLDRDGVVNTDKGYVVRKEDFKFLPGVPVAIRLLNHMGYLVIVVSNQSGIARGYYSMDDVQSLHDYVDAELARYGAKVDAYYVCPHQPTDGREEGCRCRKPKPGMLLEAAAAYSIDLANSFMVGDRMSDVAAGLAAGCVTFLVGQGYSVPDVKVFTDLMDVVRTICEKSSKEMPV